MVLNALSTAVQYTAHAATLSINSVFVNDCIKQRRKYGSFSCEEKAVLVVAATTNVATFVLPLVALCLRKAAPHHAKRVYFTAQVLRVIAAAGRAYLIYNQNKVFAVVDPVSVVLQEVALYKKRHLLAGLSAAGKIGALVKILST